MSYYCALCGTEILSTGPMHFTSYDKGFGNSFNAGMVPLMLDVPKSDGHFCHDCSKLIGNARGSNGSMFVKLDGNRRGAGIRGLRSKINNVSNVNLRTHLFEIIESGESYEEKYNYVVNNLSTYKMRCALEWDKFIMSNSLVRKTQIDGIVWMARDNDNLYTSVKTKPYYERITIGDNESDTVIATLYKLIYDALTYGRFLEISTYPINNIIYFQEKGNVQYTTSVSGGGGSGGGVNYAGAIAGDLLFGGVGAIIGSRVGTELKIDEVRSTTQTHDDRYCVLKYNSSEGGIKEVKYIHDCYATLKALIPEKEYEYVQLHRDPAPAPVSTPSANPYEQIKQLKELLDMGAITQEEFDASKKKLLNL